MNAFNQRLVGWWSRAELRLALVGAAGLLAVYLGFLGVPVSAAETFVGKVATFQRYRATLKRWVSVKRVTLTSSKAGAAPTMITSAKFRSRVRTGLRVRITLGPKQVGSCYLAGRSNTIRS